MYCKYGYFCQGKISPLHHQDVTPECNSCNLDHCAFISVSWTFMAGAASQAGDADSSRAPGLTSGLQGSVNVHRGALLLVPQ